MNEVAVNEIFFYPDTRCDHVKHAGEGWKFCSRCGSKCTRARDGTIDKYERGTKDAPRPTLSFEEKRTEKRFGAAANAPR